MLVLLALACAPEPQFAIRSAPTVTATEAPPPQGSDASTEGDPEDSTSDPTFPSTTPAGPCPAEMVEVASAFCIDPYEGALEENIAGTWKPADPWYTVDGRDVRAVPAAGIPPQGYISGDEAEDACMASGKRLCTSDEWLQACQGPEDFVYPYGDTYKSGACNDTYEGGHPVIDYFGSDDVWDMDHMNDPGINQQPNTVAAGGEFSACVSDWGAFDMHGNLHEWVDDADGVFRGGFYADAAINGPGCLYVTTAHERSYHDYSTGFRCCADRSSE